LNSQESDSIRQIPQEIGERVQKPPPTPSDLRNLSTQATGRAVLTGISPCRPGGGSTAMAKRLSRCVVSLPGRTGSSAGAVEGVGRRRRRQRLLPQCCWC